ncbi:MAG: GntR family transcriptional regulator [Lachnospiraceae bacterium]|nr:GntR family transcriptional regulator [Lachnospiraceae bacterium]
MKFVKQSDRQPAVERVLQDMREKIILHHFPEGQSLTESMLAEQYGVSRGTVRSAVQILENEGLIVIGSNGRKTPETLTDKFIRNFYSTRIMLECEAIRICMTESDMDYSVIAAACAGFYTLYAFSGEELYRRRNQVNTEFHRSLILATNNMSLWNCWKTIEPLMNAITEFNYLTLGDRQTNEELIHTHQTLMDMVMQKDQKAFSVLREHIGIAERETSMGVHSQK